MSTGREIWFTSGDGQRFVVNEGSAAYDRMLEEGSFVPDEPIKPAGRMLGAGATTDDAAEDLRKLSRPALVAKAKAVGVKASGKSPAIIAAIEAKLAEDAAGE